MRARFIRWFGLAGVLILLAASSALAQATGKIQGRVVNSETGEPIAGATVRVLGTNRGGITSEDGFYFINEVPAGLRTILAEVIGFRAFRIEDERILAGQTSTLNFRLDVAAIEVEPLVVIGERNPLVPRDQVSSKAIVTGELIDAAPVDDVAEVVVLQPGVINTNCDTNGDALTELRNPNDTCGLTIRGSRPNEASVYVDGVLTRRYGSGDAAPIELPTNSLAELDITTGGVGARFGESQSGVVNLVTRTGGTEYHGSIALQTDRLGPKSWRTGFNRAEASFGGPLLRDQNLTFFLAGVAEGQRYRPLNDGFNDVPIFVPSGVDTTFRLARQSGAQGGIDSLDVAFPNFAEWDNGPNLPFNPSDEYTFVSKLAWGLSDAVSLDFSYKREREQAITLGLGTPVSTNSELYNPDGFDGVFSTADVFTLGGYFLLSQGANHALALDVKASYQAYFDQLNELDPEWLRDHRDPGLGFNFSNMKFLVNADDFPISDELIQGVRSGVIPAESLQVFPGRRDLFIKQSLPGLAENLRLNPYGLLRDFDVSGFAIERTGGLQYREEDDWWFNATVDYQIGRYYRLQTGGELGLIDTRLMKMPLVDGSAVPSLNEPVRAALFVTNRLDLDDVVIDAGLRWDFLKPDGDFPRVPGFVFNVPDSLKADFVRVEPGEGSIQSRLVPLEDCGGEATAANRTRRDGTVVCKNNFIKARNKSEISPRLGISFPVTVKSTFRLSYSHSIQIPAFHTQSFGGIDPAAGQVGLFADQYADLQGGLANTNTEFGRDVEMPRTVLFEAGYRQLIGEDLVIDVAAYSKTRRNGLAFRKLQFTDPTTGGSTFLNVLTNADYSQTRGMDLRLDKRFGQLADVSLNYSFIDARGTGSDPFTYVDLILRRNTNLSIITGEPVIPPDAILPLEQSRRHNIAGTFSLLFPPDFEEGTPLGSALADFGVHAVMQLNSGLPYTRLLNSGNGQIGPPSLAGLGGIVAEDLNSSNTTWEKRLDLKFTKGFLIGGQRGRLFIDWRNPLNITNSNLVYLETGEVTNELHKNTIVNERLRDAQLDGDVTIDDFDIRLEGPGATEDNPGNALNNYSLLQAEQRFGDGDGIFTVAEQRAAFGAAYDLVFGRQHLEESNQSLRVGIEWVF